MSWCRMCGNTQFCIPLTCGCQQCVLHWFEDQLSRERTALETEVLCPAGTLSHRIGVEEVLEVAKGSEDEEKVEKLTIKRTAQ